MLEVDYDEQQRAFAAAAGTLCDRVRSEWTVSAFPTRTWQGLAGIGLFELARPGSGATAELAAVLEELGRQGCPGPLWDTVLAVRVLADDSLVDGSATAAVATASGPGGLAPAGAVRLSLNADGAWLAPAGSTPEGRPPTVAVLTGEGWSAGPLGPTGCGTRLDPAAVAAGLALADTALAAYLVGAAGRLVADAAGYVAARRQFNQPLGDLQGVAFPLAECDVAVAAARALTRRCAAGGANPAVVGFPPVFALISAVRAARSAVASAFQVYGAMAFTEECAVAGVARRITQLSAQALPGWRRRAAAVSVIGSARPSIQEESDAP